MFNLVIAVISITLAIAMAVATMIYMGSSFGQGGTKASIDQVVAAEAQISAAQILYQTESGGVALVDDTPGSAVQTLVQQSMLSSSPATPNFAATNAPWQVHSVGGHPVVTIDLDENSPAAKAFCAAIAAKSPGHAGCTTDVSGLALSN